MTQQLQEQEMALEGREEELARLAQVQQAKEAELEQRERLLQEREKVLQSREVRMGCHGWSWMFMVCHDLSLTVMGRHVLALGQKPVGSIAIPSARR